MARWYDLAKVKDAITIDKIIDISGGVPKGQNILLDPCPLCGHKGHFFIHKDLRKWKSFGGECDNGGDIFNLYAALHKCTAVEAFNRLGQELAIPSQPPFDPYSELIKRFDRYFAKLMIKYTKYKDDNRYKFTTIPVVENALVSWAEVDTPNRKKRLEEYIMIRRIMVMEIKRQQAFDKLFEHK